MTNGLSLQTVAGNEYTLTTETSQLSTWFSLMLIIDYN